MTKAKKYDYLKFAQSYVKKETANIFKQQGSKQRAQSARLAAPKFVTPKHIETIR